MSTTLWVIGTILIAGLLGFLGALLLLWRESFAKRFSIALVSFATGAMLGAVFFELLPESLEAVGTRAFPLVLVGILIFFVIEKLLIWYHCHNGGVCEVHRITTSKYLVLVGDSIHNFLDGVIIAAAFLISVPLGVVAAIAEFAHELPQEIGDFSIMLHSGMRRRAILLWNLVSEGASLLGGVLVLLLAGRVPGLISALIPIAAGGFIYIASADLIPELHREVRIRHSFFHFSLILAGIFVIAATGFLIGH